MDIVALQKRLDATDSLGFVRLVLELEDEYGITFSDAEIDKPEFRTGEGLAAIIRWRMNEIQHNNPGV